MDTGNFREALSEPARTALDRSAARCRLIAEHLRGSHVQELAAEALTLDAAAEGDLPDGDREALHRRARTAQRCGSFLAAVAERLDAIGE